VSDETWAVVSRVLAKNPDDRYPTPVELIDDLNELEGRSIALPPGAPKMPTGKAFKPTVTRKFKTDGGKKNAKEEKEETALDRMAGSISPNLKYILAGAAVIIVCVVIAIASMQDKPAPRRNTSSSASTQPETHESKHDEKEKKADEGAGAQNTNKGKQ